MRTRLLLGGSLAVAAAVIAVLLVRSLGDELAPGRGDWIAYGCREPKNRWYAICVIREDGTERERLTTKLATTDPSWSPDGRRIAFTRNQEAGEYTTFTDDDVFVMDADGDNVRQLTTHGRGRSAWQPAWSPDGRQIAYVNGSSVATNVPSRWGALFVMNADGTDAHRLTQSIVDTNPTWSPDGRQIAFARCVRYASSPPRCAQDLFAIDAVGSGSRRLSSTKRLSETVPSWSPDGSRIAFVALAPIDAPRLQDREGVYVMNRDGSGVRLVVAQQYLEGAVSGLAWSADGKTIAFETAPTFVCTAISLVDAESGRVRPLTTCTRPTESAVSPAWQPDTEIEH